MRIPVLSSLLCCLLPLASLGFAGNESPTLPSVLVRGVLVDSQGAPIGAHVLHLAPCDAGGRAFVALRDGEILNPTATTDAAGRFALLVPIAFFATGSDFTVGTVRTDAIPPGAAQVPVTALRRNGQSASFAYQGKRQSIDLGEVTLP
jgi:hypothetical protein